MSGRGLILVLLKPALLSRGGLASSGLALDLDLLGLVGAQLIGEVGFFGRLGGSRSAELLDVGISVTGLDGRRLVGTKLAKVEFLDRVGCRMLEFVGTAADYSIAPKGTIKSTESNM